MTNPPQGPPWQGPPPQGPPPGYPQGPPQPQPGHPYGSPQRPPQGPPSGPPPYQGPQFPGPQYPGQFQQGKAPRRKLWPWLLGYYLGEPERFDPNGLKGVLVEFECAGGISGQLALRGRQLLVLDPYGDRHEISFTTDRENADDLDQALDEIFGSVTLG